MVSVMGWILLGMIILKAIALLVAGWAVIRLETKRYD